MPLSSNINNREFDKFTTVSGDLTAVRVDGAFSGNFIPSGLKTAIKTSTFYVTDVAAPIPGVALLGRNSLTITNLDMSETLYVGPSTVTADRVVGTTSGHEVGPGEGFNIDITDAVILYGIAETGKTILVKATEVA